MFRYCVLVALLVAEAIAAPVINFDASAYCFQCLSRRNHKDLYPDPNNRANYYQCQYLEDNKAIATLRSCAAGQIWGDSVLTCIPDGTVAGSDKVTPAPVSINSTVCMDSTGVYISSVAGNSNAFGLIDAEGNVAAVMRCPNNYVFSLATCACTVGDFDNSNLTPVSKATFYMDYNRPTSFKDLSINNFAPDFLNGATVTNGLSDHNPNGSSLSLPNAGADVEIAGLKNFDFGSAASFCGFFRCDYYANNLNCNQSGAIFSNNKDSSSSEFTIVAGVQATNTFVAKLAFRSGNVVTLTGAFTVGVSTDSPQGFSGFCVTYDGQTASLYLNGALSTSQAYEGVLATGQCPFTIGNDQSLGSFLGHVDSTLILPFAWSAASVTSFWQTGEVPAALLA